MKVSGVSKSEVFDLAVKIQNETGGRYKDSIEKALNSYGITWNDLKDLCANS